MKIALLDCDDSFTYNIYDLLKQCGAEVDLIHYKRLPLDFEFYQAIVLPPGPKSPEEIPQIHQLIDRYYSLKPLLGICLGHQALGKYFGHQVIKSTNPMHGVATKIKPNSDLIFDKIDTDNFYAMRFNSLTVKELDSSELKIICSDDQGEIMGFKHKSFPIYSFQFHPESIGTPDGKKIIKNWLKIVSEYV